jgi:hypothetical protein
VNIERDAIRVLAERGWCKGKFHDAEGRVCMGTAVMFGSGLLNRVISEQFPDRRGGVIGFNDHPDTTIDDVILVLEKASIRRDEQVSP